MDHPASPALPHHHAFTLDTTRNEKNTLRVVIITAVMMTGEIIGGLLFGSMALLADGFHMGTHAFALGITLAAYGYARRHAKNPAFSFGTGKVGDLGGYTSAVLLLVVALIMAVESFERFLSPVSIHFSEAILVAVIGLAVNLASAFILRDQHDHHGHHEHEEDEHEDHEHHHAEEEHAAAHGHQDHNIKAAYLHVLADALTSVLAIMALVLGKFLGWAWMDPLMGIVGALVITRWSIGLLKETSAVLLDKTANARLAQTIRSRLDGAGDPQIRDLHLWEVAPQRYALILSLASPSPHPVDHYRCLLANLPQLAHITIEVLDCPDPAEPLAPAAAQ